MKRGIRFKIDNKFGTFISDILQPVNCKQYKWSINNEEVWVISNGEFSKPLFEESYVTGSKLVELINENTYYMIFLVLKAFPKDKLYSEVSSYEEFTKSDCELIMLVADCNYIDLYCKDEVLTEKLYNNADVKGYYNLRYIDESDSRTGMYV